MLMMSCYLSNAKSYNFIRVSRRYIFSSYLLKDILKTFYCLLKIRNGVVFQNKDRACLFVDDPKEEDKIMMTPV